LRERFTHEPLGRDFQATLVEFEKGRVVIDVPVLDRFLVLDPAIVQGGVTAVVADFAAVYAAMSMFEEGHTPALNIDLFYERPITKDDEFIRATALVRRASSHHVLVDVEVVGRDGKMKVCGAILFAAPRQRK